MILRRIYHLSYINACIISCRKALHPTVMELRDCKVQNSG